MCKSDIYNEEVSGGVLRKDEKLYVAFMDLEKVSDRVDREALWSMLKIMF